MNDPFYDDADNRLILRSCRTLPEFIPIVIMGQLHPIKEQLIATYPVPSNISPQDYVLGLEVLGCRFARNSKDEVVVQEPLVFPSMAWNARSRQIQAVMVDHWEGRHTAVSDYLHQRRSLKNRMNR